MFSNNVFIANVYSLASFQISDLHVLMKKVPSGLPLVAVAAFHQLKFTLVMKIPLFLNVFFANGLNGKQTRSPCVWSV